MLLLSTSSLQGYGLHRIFDFAKKSGFDGIDLALNNTNYDLWDDNYIKYLSDSFGVPVLSITAQEKGMNEKKVDRIIKIAIKLKTQIVTFSPAHIKDDNKSWYETYIGKVKRDSHISIAIKNVEPKFILFIISEYSNATLGDIKKPTGITTLDISSIDPSSGLDILKAHKILGSSMKNILFSDKNGSKSGLIPGNAGGGISYLPLESFLMKLKTMGYTGFFTLTVKPTELGVGNEEKVLQNLEYAKKYYEKHFLNYK